MKLEIRKPDKKQTNLVFSFLSVAVLILCIWKIRYGFGWYDEAFYITIPHRMLLGDAFVVDEWHPAQLFGFLTMPFVAAYRAVQGNTDGVMLFMRVVYLVCHFLIGAFIYKRLSERFGLSVVFCTISFLLFTPFDIMAPSYNSIGADLMAFICVGIATEENGKRNPVFVLYGAAYSAVVLCCPYLVVLLLPIIAIVVLGRKKEKPLLSVRAFLLFAAGIAVMFAAFIAFESTRTTVKEFIRNFPQLFMDAEHTGENIIDKLKSYFNHAPHHFGISIGLFLSVMLGLAIDKKRKEHARVWIILSCGAALWAYLWSYANLNEYYNAIMMPLFFPGIVAYILLEKKPKRMFTFIMVPGLVYSVCMCVASNVGFHAVSIAYAVVNIASACFIGMFFEGSLAKKNPDSTKKQNLLRMLALVALAGAALSLLFVQIKTKITHVFYDEAPAMLTVEITEGPAKGIKTTGAKANEYNKYLKEMKSFAEGNDGQSLLILSEKTWCYLMNDQLTYSTYSAWLSGVNEASVSRLKEYYGCHKNEMPDLIFIDKPFYLEESDVLAFSEQYGYSVEKSKIAYKLKRTLQE